MEEKDDAGLENPYKASGINRDTAGMGDRDDAELRLLARLHYVLAALTAAFSIIALPFIWVGATTMRHSAAAADEAYLAGVLWFSAGVLWASLCLVHAGVVYYIGRLVGSCRRWWLVMIFSVLHLINVPLGTALSVYAFIVMKRETVKKRFKTGRGMRDER
jgi:hypothetical protein